MKTLISLIVLLIPFVAMSQSKVITLHKNKVTQIILHENIQSVKGGFLSEDLVSDIENNVLYLQPVDSIPETNINIITVDDTYFSFTLRYDSNANIFNFMYDKSDALFKGNSKNTTEQIDMNNIRPICDTMIHQTTHIKDTILNPRRDIKGLSTSSRIVSERILSRTGYLNTYNSVGIKNLKVSLKGVYIHSDKMYFRLEIDNTSNIKYDLEYIAFYVRAIKKKKSVTDEIVQYKPIYIYNTIKSIPPKRKVEIIYCFDKFTISSEKHLTIDIIEHNGERNLTLPVATNIIMDAKPI